MELISEMVRSYTIRARRVMMLLSELTASKDLLMEGKFAPESLKQNIRVMKL